MDEHSLVVARIAEPVRFEIMAGATVGQKWLKQVIRALHLHGGTSGSQMLRTVFQ